METPTFPTPTRQLSLLIYILGVALGLFLTLAAVWADLEARNYDFIGRIAQNNLTTLRCPVLLTTRDQAEISLTVPNDSDREITPLVRVIISSPGPFRQIEKREPIAPGESRTYTYPVSKEDVDLRYFILVRAYKLPTFQSPAEEGTCGIMMLDIPFVSGSVLLVLGTMGAVGGMYGGWWWWRKEQLLNSKRSGEIASGMLALSIILTGGMIFGYLGNWMVGGAFLILAVLMIGGLIFIANARQ